MGAERLPGPTPRPAGPAAAVRAAPTPALLVLQRGAGNRAVTQHLTGRPVVQRDGPVPIDPAVPGPPGPGNSPSVGAELEIERQALLLRTPLPDPDPAELVDLDPHYVKNLVARLSQPLSPAQTSAVLTAMVGPLAPKLVWPPAPPPWPAAPAPPRPAGTPETLEQLAAPAAQRQKEMIRNTGKAANKLIEFQVGKSESWVPPIARGVTAGLVGAMNGSAPESALGNAAGTFALGAAGKLVPELAPRALHWFQGRSTVEQFAVIVPPAALLGFGSIFGTVAVVEAEREGSAGWLSLRDKGLPLIGNKDITMPGLPWLQVRLEVSTPAAAAGQPGSPSAGVTGGMLKVDVGRFLSGK